MSFLELDTRRPVGDSRMDSFLSLCLSVDPAEFRRGEEVLSLLCLSLSTLFPGSSLELQLFHASTDSRMSIECNTLILLLLFHSLCLQRLLHLLIWLCRKIGSRDDKMVLSCLLLQAASQHAFSIWSIFSGSFFLREMTLRRIGNSPDTLVNMRNSPESSDFSWQLLCP